MLVLGHTGVGKSSFINAIATIDKEEKKHKKHEEIKVLYAADQLTSKVYEVEITEYLMSGSSSLVGSYF